MSEVWPANLIEELAYRRCVIFIGSGVSATAKNGEGQSPETWSVFLNNIKEALIKSTCADLRQKFLLTRKKIAGILTDFKIF